MLTLSRVAINVAIAEQALEGRLPIVASQPDDNDMNVRHPSGVAPPGESTVSEADFKPVAVKENRPELRDLLALRDRVSGDESSLPVTAVNTLQL